MNKVAYKALKLLIKMFTKKPKMYGLQHIQPDEPLLYMANHAGFYGPIAVSCYFDKTDKIWANSMVIDTRASMEYTTSSLFEETLGWRKFPAKIAGGVLGWLMAGLMQNEDLITVYWDAGRARQTIVAGVKVVADSESQLMFARNANNTNAHLPDTFDFDKGYQLVIHQALKRHGIAAKLYPVAINQFKRTFAVGPPVALNPNKPLAEEKKRINDYLVKAVQLGYHSPEALEALPDAKAIY